MASTAISTNPPAEQLAALIEQAVAAAFQRHFASTPTLVPKARADPPHLPEPDALLTRPATAIALTAAGFPTSTATLTTKATRGGGPPFRHWGPRVLYRWEDALAWAQTRVSKPRRNTSEPDQPAV